MDQVRSVTAAGLLLGWLLELSIWLRPGGTQVRSPLV